MARPVSWVVGEVVVVHLNVLAAEGLEPTLIEIAAD